MCKLSQMMHAGTYPAFHVHVGGGHVACCWRVALCWWRMPSHLCELTAFIHLNVRSCFVWQTAESAHTQSLFVKGLTMRMWGLFINTTLTRKTPICIFTHIITPTLDHHAPAHTFHNSWENSTHTTFSFLFFYTDNTDFQSQPQSVRSYLIRLSRS